VHVRKDSLLLPGAYPWVPTLPNTQRSSTRALVSEEFRPPPGGRAGRVSKTLDGWRTVRTTFRSDQPVTLVGRKALVRHPFELDGVPCFSRSSAGRRQASGARVVGAERVRVVEADRAAAAPPRDRVVPATRLPGIASRGFIGLDDFDAHVVAHELAHQYFQDIDDHRRR